MESEFSSYSAALIFSTADSLHLPELFLAGGEPFLLFVLTSSAALFFLLFFLGESISLSILYKSIALAAERASVSFSYKAS